MARTSPRQTETILPIYAPLNESNLIIPSLPPLPSKLPLLQTPKDRKTDRTERKSQLEAHIAPVRRIANPLAYGTYEPHLRHAHNGTEDAKAESKHSRDAGWEQARIIPYGDVVFALLEDEVLGKGDAFVDG